MIKQRKDQIKAVSQNSFENEDPFTDQDLDNLFALNLSDKKELLKFYKSNPKIQFAVESMLANGNTLKFSNERDPNVVVEPLTKWEHMKFRVDEDSGLRQTESQTPSQLFEAWASKFTTQTPIVKLIPED